MGKKNREMLRRENETLLTGSCDKTLLGKERFCPHFAHFIGCT